MAPEQINRPGRDGGGHLHLAVTVDLRGRRASPRFGSGTSEAML